MSVDVQFTGNEPTQAYAGDAGFDLVSDESVLLLPGQHRLVSTGTRIALPEGTVGLVCPRSGLANKYGITVANAPGIVDSGYRGTIMVNMINHGSVKFQFEPGVRIAQLVVVPVVGVNLVKAESLPASERGDKGHGSSGV